MGGAVLLVRAVFGPDTLTMKIVDLLMASGFSVVVGLLFGMPGWAVLVLGLLLLALFRLDSIGHG